MINLFKWRNKKKIFLDYASATPILPEIECEINKYKDIFYNPSAIYKDGVNTKNIINQSRNIIANILSCREHEIYFTSSATESINLAISGVIRNYYIDNVWENKDKTNTQSSIPSIITTNIEHPAVLETLRWYERMGMINIIYLKVDNNGLINTIDLREILQQNNNIILVTIMYVNNEIGSVLPVRDIGRIIYDYNRLNNKKIIYHIDACQAANYYELNVRKLRADMLSLNSSKIYGGKGAGLLYKSNSIRLEPIVYGGGQERGLRSGTENIASIIGLSKALQIASEYRESEYKRLREMQEYFFSEIRNSIPDVRLWGAIDDMIESRCPNNINISLPNINSDEMIIRLDQLGFMVSHKSACDSHNNNGSYVLMAIGASIGEAQENIRITMGRHTQMNDIKELIIAIKDIYNKYKK